MRQQLAVALLCLLGLAFTSCVSKKQYATMEAGLRQQLERERQKQYDTETDLREAKRASGRYHAELSDLQPRYTDLQSQYTHLKRQNAALSEQLDKLSAQTTILQTNVEEKATVLDLQKKIAEQLRDQIAAKDVKIEAIESKLKVTFVDKILFRSGSAKINAQGQQTLRKVALAIHEDTKHMIEVQGHIEPNHPVPMQNSPILGAAPGLRTQNQHPEYTPCATQVSNSAPLLTKPSLTRAELVAYHTYKIHDLTPLPSQALLRKIRDMV